MSSRRTTRITSRPSACPPTRCHADGKAVLKYVETKAVVGGVTAIQGSAKVGPVFEGWMVQAVIPGGKLDGLHAYYGL